MKKLLYLIFLTSNLANAQYLGVKIGFTSSNVPEHDLNRLLSPNFGAYFMYGKDKFKATIEPSINTKGFSVMTTYTNSTGDPIGEARANYRFKYFEIPISFGIYPSCKKSLFGVNAGFAPSILMNAKDGIGNEIVFARPFNVDVFSWWLFRI